MRHPIRMAKFGIGLLTVLVLACGGGENGTRHSSAPLFNLGPSSQSVMSGESVTFSVTVTGVPEPTIRWERSNDSGAHWNLISAATGLSYAFTAQITDDGSWFRVTATNSSGTSQSHPARLSVAVPDFWVDHATFTQGILKEGIPLVAGKAGVLQVYVVANASTSIKPPVTVDVYQADVKVRTLSAVPPMNNTPTTPIEVWNVRMSGEDCQPGNTFVIQIDPNNTLIESNKYNNIYPLSGNLSYTFNILKTFDLTMVPIVLSYGLPGINDSNIHAYTQMTRSILPIGPMVEILHSPFTPSISTAETLDDWGLIANELRAIHLIEKPEGDYYGILHANPVPSKNPAAGAYFGIRTILGIDPTPWPGSNAGNQVIAHEIGHSFFLRHTPCGTGDDYNNPYPYPDGIINNPGIDPITLRTYTAKAKDLMGYCATKEGLWISDYNYNIAYNYRASNANSPIASHPESQSFLLWGRRVGATWILEPSFNLAQIPTPPEPGDMRIEGVTKGQVVFSVQFAPSEWKGEKSFAFSLPGHYDLDSIHLYEGDGEVASIQKKTGTLDLPLLVTSRSGLGHQVQLKWNPQTHPRAMVMNEKGEVIAFLRGTSGATKYSEPFPTMGKDHTVHLSYGTGSAEFKIRNTPSIDTQ